MVILVNLPQYYAYFLKIHLYILKQIVQYGNYKDKILHIIIYQYQQIVRQMVVNYIHN